jgi:peptidoglycan hydrolase-like protein with peptidoglycan-binding domain
MKTKINQPEVKKPSSTPFFTSLNSSGFLGVQTKLTTGKPDDQYETEADNIAEKVVNRSQDGYQNSTSQPIQRQANHSVQEKPLAEIVSPLVQKKDLNEEDKLRQKGDANKQNEDELQLKTGIGQSEKEEEEPIQLKEKEDDDLTKTHGETTASPNIESKLNNSSGGQKMDANVQAEMENGFGTDLSRVNIHTDATAVQMNRQLGAQAFTHGNDIYFNKGKYNPDSNNGKHLLAHELTHTIQQSGMVPTNLQFTIGDNHDLTSARFSGDAVLEACFDGERVLQQGSNGAAVTLIQQALIDAGFPLPQFGADGSFGTETRNALKDFQRSSALVDDGKVGPATMSALDSLFSGGAPSLPPVVPVVPTPTTPPTVTTQTIVSAPDGTADTRTTVGVGERVRFTSPTAGTWTVSDGRIIGLNTGANMVWEAPAVAANPIITITTPGGATATAITVIAPTSLNMVVANRDAIAVGTAGACMITNVTVNPANVSFGRTQWLEVPGPATNVTGYFTRFSAAGLRHQPNPRYLPFDDLNTGLTDHAAMHNAPPAFSFGTFDWVIPNRYKIDGETDAQGKFFVNTTQAFTIFSNGTVMIIKSGGFVLRSTTNVVI